MIVIPLKSKVAIAIVSSLLLSAFARADVQYRLTTLSSGQGLSQQDVECMVQDQKGFIWIGTYDGLNRYDGHNFTLFRHIPYIANSISDNRILTLCEWRERNELWIGTDGGGVNCYNLKKGEFSHYQVSAKMNRAFANSKITAFDKNGNSLWFTTAKDVTCMTFDADNRMHLVRYPLDHLSNHKYPFLITSMAHDKMGNIIVSSSYEVFVKDRRSQAFHKAATFPSMIKQVYSDAAGNLWIVTRDYLYYYSLMQQRMPNYLLNPYIPSFIPTGKFRKIMSITEYTYLVLSQEGLYWLNVMNNSFRFTPVLFSMNRFWDNNEMKSLMLDRTMNVWISSSMDGVARFDLNAKAVSHSLWLNDMGIDKSFVQALVKDNYNKLWIGTTSGAFLRNISSQNIIKVNKIDEAVYGMMQDWNHNVWITSLANVFCARNGDYNNIVSVKSMPGFSAKDCPMDGPYSLCTNNRDCIWIGMRNGLLKIASRASGYAFKLEKLPTMIPPSNIYNLTKLLYQKSPHGDFILIGTLGLWKADLSPEGEIKKVEKIEPFEKGRNEFIWSIFRGSDNVIYIGTDSGLKRLVRDARGKYKLEYVFNDFRLRTYKIASIIEDNEKNLWLSTSQGLLRYNINTHKVETFLESDGLSSNVLCEGSLFDPSSNQLFIGSIKGLNAIDLNTLKSNGIPPFTQLIALKINNTLICPSVKFNGHIILHNNLEYTDEIELRHDENNFTIEFSTMHFSNPAKNAFMYRLKGFNDKWTVLENNQRSATFTNIPPGSYIFEVRSANCDGVWGSEVRTLTIDIAPPFWASWWAYIIYLAIASYITFFVMKYFRDKRAIKQKFFMEHLEHTKEMEMAEEKLRYHTNITHELRTPLSLITGPIEELTEYGVKDDFIKSRVAIIKNNTDHLLQLVGQFLDFRKVINEKYELNVKFENLDSLLHKIIDDFSLLAKQKNISLEYINDMSSQCCWFDSEIITKICFNLLSNALKYTNDNGRVILYASADNDNAKALISVEDTGIGIGEKDIGKIFNRFYQVQGTLGGSGIGLNLCKHLSQIHKGFLSVVSHLGVGSIFTLEIPITHDAYSDSIVEISDNDVLPYGSGVGETITLAAEEKDWKPQILVIEDNSEMRDYIVNLLSGENKVIAAANGKEGLEKAIGFVPDLVICDVMMPVMDGIEFTRRAKDDIRTSHVPIILLTAKVTKENEIEGLSYGADDYVTKPFSPKILKLRIKNLLRLTKKKQQEVVNEGKEKLNEREKSFLDSFEKIVNDNMSAPDFGIDDICKLIFMSRMQLYRKLVAITNKKPSQYIKELKMKKAYSLMKEKGLNITETLYEVGYTNYSHFSKLFTEVNGISPRELLGMKGKSPDDALSE